MSTEDQSLLERVEAPSIPESAMKQIAILEEQFARAEVEQMRNTVKLTQPLINKRAEIIKMPEVQAEFWMRVFASAPPEIDEYILTDDAAILGEALTNMTVERFELDAQGNGEPRSLRFIFEFKSGEENPFFTNDKLVKDFYWRQEVTKSSSGRTRTWEGLVSEPVRINWKKDKDLTRGLLDAACDLWDAEKKKGGDRKNLPEFAALVKKIEEADEAEDAAENDDDEDMPSPVGMSFFGFFGYRGRDVSAAQSKEAAKEIEARWAKVQKGEDITEGGDSDDEDEDEDDDEDGLEVAEIFPDGDDLAVAIAEDLWADALRYYVQSYQNADDLEDMDLEMEMDEMDEDEDEESESRPRKKARN